MKILITGANGFVGSHLVRFLEGHELAAIGRTEVAGVEQFIRITLSPDTDFSGCFNDVGCIVHAAARAHIMKDEADDPLAEYRKVNVAGTLNLARQAATAGVKRFIYISSIKVNGEQTLLGKPFTEEDMPAPTDAYGLSKHEAEQGLRELAEETGMEVVIIRPPLVYGPGVKGNFANMIKLVGKGLPLPLGAVHNKRSFVALDNLVDLIITCIDHPGAANETFLVSDGEDLSTTQLLRGVAEAMGKLSRLIPVPASLLQFGATLIGKKAVAQRLLGSLQVDISHTQKCLNWLPPLTVKQGLQRCFPNQQD